MLDIFSITGVIFLLIGVGYLSVRLGVFSSTEMAPIGKFVVTFALPALIFRAVAYRPISEIANIGYLAAVVAGSLAVFVFGAFLSSRREKYAPLHPDISVLFATHPHSYRGFGVSGLICHPLIAARRVPGSLLSRLEPR